MPQQGKPDPKDLARHMALAQVGLEMVSPVAVGAWLDYYFHWAPWATIGGAVLGFVGGMAHLMAILNRGRDNIPPQQQQDPS